jgi:hypothetical protein
MLCDHQVFALAIPDGKKTPNDLTFIENCFESRGFRDKSRTGDEKYSGQPFGTSESMTDEK